MSRWMSLAVNFLSAPEGEGVATMSLLSIFITTAVVGRSNDEYADWSTDPPWRGFTQADPSGRRLLGDDMAGSGGGGVIADRGTGGTRRWRSVGVSCSEKGACGRAYVRP